MSLAEAKEAVAAAFSAGDLAALTAATEALELEACGCDQSAGAAGTYAMQMLAYLGQNDLNNARFLWRRAPDAVKADGLPLARAWRVGQGLWQEAYEGPFALLVDADGGAAWGGGQGAGGGTGVDLAPLAALVAARVRARNLELIGRAFSSITPARAAALLGLDEAGAAAACAEVGWKQEGTAILPAPLASAAAASGAHLQTGLPQLEQLCRYVAHLEKK